MGERIIWGSYFVLFSLAALFYPYASLLFLLVVVLNAAFLIRYPEQKDLILFSSAIIGSEPLALLNVLMFVAISIVRDGFHVTDRFKRRSVVVAGLICGYSFLSSILYDTTWNVVFYIGYLCILLVTYKYAQMGLQTERLLSIIKKFVVLEFMVSGIIIVVNRTIQPGDTHGGSLRNAHFFANWLILVIFLLLTVRYAENELQPRHRFNSIAPYLLMCLMMLALSDGKNLVGAAFFGVVLYVLIGHWRETKRNDLFWLICISYAGAFLVLGILFSDPVRRFISSHSSYLATYMYEPGWNGKFGFYYGTFFEVLRGFRLLFGFGLGQYGSRVANLFAYESMWRGDNAINNFVANTFEAHCLPQYEKYISFYTQEFVDGIQWRSAVLSYPFNNFTALIGEVGIVGVLLVAYWLNKEFKGCRCKVLFYYFLMVCAFDLYFDDYQTVLMMILLVANVTSYEKRQTIAPKDTRAPKAVGRPQ